MRIVIEAELLMALNAQELKSPLISCEFGVCRSLCNTAPEVVSVIVSKS